MYQRNIIWLCLISFLSLSVLCAATRPHLKRSDSSFHQHIALWPENLVDCLISAYAMTQNIHLMNRSQFISDTILKQTGKFRSPIEVKRKIQAMGMQI